jgi:hypothetical protein
MEKTLKESGESEWHESVGVEPATMRRCLTLCLQLVVIVHCRKPKQRVAKANAQTRQSSISLALIMQKKERIPRVVFITSALLTERMHYKRLRIAGIEKLMDAL